MFDRLTDVELARLVTKLQEGLVNLILIADSVREYDTVREFEMTIKLVRAEISLREFIMVTNAI